MSNINFYYEDHYCLNNLSAHEVKFMGIIYKTAEHAYQCQKFFDKKICNSIKNSRSPLQAKAIAHKNMNVMRLDWNKVKLKIMGDIVLAKVKQHHEVYQTLINTGNKKIVENSPDDYFWGIGKYKTGKNHMGKLLMQLRKELTKSKIKTDIIIFADG